MTKYFKDRFAVYGDAVEIPDSIQSNGSVSYQQGFTVDYQRRLGSDPLAKPFPRQGFNGLMSDITGAIQQYQQQGFYDFITPEMNGGEAFPYDMGATVRYDMSDNKDGSNVHNFTSLINDNTGNPKDNSDDWMELGSSKSGGYGFAFTTITTNTTLTEDHSGVVLIDASAGDITVTLPNTDNNIGFILRRIDNTVYKVKIQASGTDKIKYNVSINANGYSFFHLFGAGDYWRVVSDGLGNWFDIERKDNNPIGGVEFIISTLVPVGGYVVANGTLLNRTDYPYLWDYAQKSGALVAESEITEHEGCFTSGDGSTTFRLPDLRGKFLRALDNGLGVDANRTAGSYQQDAIQNITGTITNGASVDGSSGVFTNSGAGRTGTQGTAGGGRLITFDASTVVRTADEVRPKNIAYPVYIKII